MNVRIGLVIALALVACRHKDDLDEDGYDVTVDCNDADGAVFPGAVEICNDVDDNCDVLVDNDATDQKTTYGDGDADGYGDPVNASTGCVAPAGFVDDNTDCDDGARDIYPGAAEADCTDPIDYNCDGSSGFADADGDGYAACKDCDDKDAQISPIGVELCDGDDNNCDGTTDEDSAANAKTWYADTDTDGFGDATSTKTACEAPTGYVDLATDCDDSKSSIAPGAAETCDKVDQNCNGVLDDGAADTKVWYADADGDGHGSKSLSLTACDQPDGYVATSTDCDDVDPTSYPSAPELCDGFDNDCNNLLPTNEADADDDTFLACKDDCDDTKAAVAPDAPEKCNAIDDDCDGQIDEGDAVDPTTFYADGDGDGFGTPTTFRACAAPVGWATLGGDCNDANDLVNPSEVEDCDGFDNNCDGKIDPVTEVLGMRAACSAAQCKDVLDRRPSAASGVYWIRGADKVPFQAYCDMTTAGGGWTLALKANGANTTFLYDAPLWTNATLLRPTSAGFDRTEAKLPTFTKIPFQQMMVALETPIGATGAPVVSHLELPVAANNLQALFSGGYVATTLTKPTWKGLVANSSMQDNCNREGVNVTSVPFNAAYARVRVGILGNNENDCGTPDSRLGLGGDVAPCGPAGTNSVGNVAGCIADNGDTNLTSFGWLFVRCTGGADTLGDGIDQNCDYTDGVDGDGDGEASLASGGPDCDDANQGATFANGRCSLPATCLDILQATPSASNGLYAISPESGRWVRTYCDMARGGWTMGFLKNTVHATPIYANAGAKFGAGFVANNGGTAGAIALARTPTSASATTETTAVAGWLDMNTFPAAQIRLNAYADGSETYVSDAINVAQLRLDFGNNGYYLYAAPAEPPRVDGDTYYWCGGDTAYTDSGIGQVNPIGPYADCKGHGSLGNGWDFSHNASTPGGNSGLTLCGGIPLSNWMYTSYGAGLLTYPVAGGAQAVFLR